MSKSALLFLSIGLACAALLWLAPTQPIWLETLVIAGLAVSGSLFLLALLMGKKIKFDPLLR